MRQMILSWIATAFLSASGVAVILKKYGPKIFKGITVAHDALDLLDDLVIAAKPEADGSVVITADEIKHITLEIEKLKADLK